MIDISHFIEPYRSSLVNRGELAPWDLVADLPDFLQKLIADLGSDYEISGGIAIHKIATIEQHVILKAPVIIGAKCFVGAHAYLRGGVFLDEWVTVGPGSEVKSSIIFSNSALAHFNFVGNSIVGSRVNFEAGAIIANHFNERTDKSIRIKHNGQIMVAGTDKFGAIVGDDCRIGANAVLSPGTVLEKGTIVKRLELVEQVPTENTK